MAIIPKSLGLSFIASIIAENKIGTYLKLGPCAYLFEHSPAELEKYTKFEKFVSAYGKIPDKHTFEEETGEVLPDAVEPPTYYKDKLFERHVHRSLVLSSEKAAELLAKKDPKGAFDIIKGMVNKTELARMGASIFDFRDSHDLIMQSVNSKLSPTEKEGLEFGWPSFDAMSGGCRGKDLISFVGRPAVGKSYFSLASGLNGWREQKKSILFVSMEMSALLVFERLSSMYAHIPADWLKTGGFPTFPVNEKNKFSKTLKTVGNYDNPLWVVDGNLTATVEDISALCYQLKPDAVFVDGAYLLKVPGKFGKYEKIGEIAQGLKSRIAGDHDVPVVASWQFNRESMKIKKGDKVGLEHIAGSDEIGQLSSIVLGLFQEDSAETITRRKIDILKGRSGEIG